MKKNKLSAIYTEYTSADELSAADRELLTAAQQAAKDAYAPYSNFKVGAVALLENGEIITGTNQENASFPAGICAERVLLSSIASRFPGMPVKTIAISYKSRKGKSDHPISPCGICRQSILEYELRTHKKIRLLLGGKEGPVIEIPDATILLPLAFTGKELD